MNWTYEDEIKFQRMDAYLEGQTDGEKYGEERGIFIGKKCEKLETALAMLKEGLDLSLIQKVTGLSKKQIFNYQKELSEN